MRRTLLSLLAIVSLAAKPAFSNAEELNFEDFANEASQDATNGDIAINETNFPDAIFRNWILRQDYGKDGKLTEEEIAGVRSINVSGKSISSLKGIEYFTALESLWCSSNQLTALDVSKNTALTSLDCTSNQLTSIDVSMNTALRYFDCSSNRLTSLDVSKNTAFITLKCSSNQLTSLDVSKNTSLTWLNCSSNQLTSLDVSMNTALESLYCFSNQLTSLDVSKNTVLTTLWCYFNQLTSLDVSKNAALSWLWCSSNKLTSLDVSKNSALTTLYCHRNQIKGKAMDELINSLPYNSSDQIYGFYVMSQFDDDEGNICTQSQVAAAKDKGWIPYYWDGSSWNVYEDGELDPNAINISSINFPDENFHNWILEQEYGKDGKLTEDEIKNVTSMDVYKMNISTLKGIEYFTSLKSLDCGSNQLTALDVSKNTALESMRCSFNQLTSLDVSKNTALESLYCVSNQLTSLDVSKNTALTVLWCSSNQLTTLDVSMNTALTRLDCSFNQLTSLDVSKNTALTTLECVRNQLTSLDVSKNTALTWLDCNTNQLTTLDVSKNTALDWLSCSFNQLTSLDVSNNTALTHLDFGSNQLTFIDVSMNTALILLNCMSNQLSSLDVSQNPSLRTFYCYRNHIKGKAMDDLISSMPYNSSGKIYVFLVVSTADDDEGNVCTKSQVAAIKAKGWTPEYWDGFSLLEYEGSEDSSQEKGNPILITHIADSYDTINDVTYDISEYDAMKLDGILNEYMADENRGENQEFYLEGGKNYYIGSFLSIYKGFTLQTNPADLAAGKGRAKIYLGGLCKQGESYVNYANFMLGRVPFDGEDETMTLDIDSIRFIDLDFDVPLATNYGQVQEYLVYATGNYFMNMYSNGLGVNLTTLEWRNCSFQGLIRGFIRIQGFNNKNIHHIRMIGCDFYNCGYYSQNGRDYGYFFGDHSGLEKSNIFEDIEVAECVFYNSPKSSVVTDNNRNVEWDESVRWHINLHHNTFVNLSTLSNNPILNTRYIPGGSVLEFHDNIIINTKDANDVNRTMYCAGWDARYILGGDGSGQATFNIFNNWTTNDEEYLVDGQPFTANAFNAAWNSPGMIISNGQGICPAGTDELVVHLEETLRATDMMESPNPPYFIGASPKGTDFHTDKGIDGLYYKQTPDVLNSAIYKSGAGASKLRNPVLKKGDVNADGEVGIGDIITITNVMAGDGTEEVIKRADVNGDGEVGIGDIISITNIMAGE